MLDFLIDPSRCIQCGECAADCPVAIIDMQDGLPNIPEHKHSYCIQCQHCLAVCPTGALSIAGKSPDQSQALAFPAANTMENLIKGRRSVRRYTPEPVQPDILDRLMDAVAHAPTGKNQRQTRLTLIDDTAVMDRIRMRTMAGIRKSTLEGTLPVGMEFFAKFLDPFDAGRDIIFRWAPHMLIASAPDESAAPKADPFIALSYFELMAATLGIGTVWCGFAQMALQYVVPELGQALGIPRDHQSLYTMMFGYPDVHYVRTVQRDVQGVHRVCLRDLEEKL